MDQAIRVLLEEQLLQLEDVGGSEEYLLDHCAVEHVERVECLREKEQVGANCFVRHSCSAEVFWMALVTQTYFQAIRQAVDQLRDLVLQERHQHLFFLLSVRLCSDLDVANRQLSCRCD